MNIKPFIFVFINQSEELKPLNKVLTCEIHLMDVLVFMLSSSRFFLLLFPYLYPCLSQKFPDQSIWFSIRTREVITKRRSIEVSLLSYHIFFVPFKLAQSFFLITENFFGKDHFDVEDRQRMSLNSESLQRQWGLMGKQDMVLRQFLTRVSEMFFEITKTPLTCLIDLGS